MRAIAELSHASDLAWFAAGVLSCAVAMRVAVVSVQTAVARATPGVVAAAGGEAEAGSEASPPDAGSPGLGGGPSRVAPGASLRIPLVVTAGPERSTVIVNGAVVGQSPYLGEVSCKSGETVTVELVPERGLPLVRHRRCSPGTLRIAQ